MQIIKITSQNIQEHLSALITLNDQFLDNLDISKQRTRQQKEAILRNMVKPNSPTHLLIGYQDQQAVGMTYFNEGTGYSCGGDYIWINSMFIVQEEQSKGHGSAFLSYIEDWATAKGGVTLIVSSRDTANKHSGNLFKSKGYEQSENVWIAKKL